MTQEYFIVALMSWASRRWFSRRNGCSKERSSHLTQLSPHSPFPSLLIEEPRVQENVKITARHSPGIIQRLKRVDFDDVASRAEVAFAAQQFPSLASIHSICLTPWPMRWDLWCTRINNFVCRSRMDVRVCEKLHFDLQFFDNNFSQPTEVCCVLCAGAYSAYCTVRTVQCVLLKGGSKQW